MLNIKLVMTLAPAYAPCTEFARTCAAMCWRPDMGHVPRGYLGATGSLEEVELVLVFAEPGDPHVGEKHAGMQSAYEYAMHAFQSGMDLFHRNVRSILDLCWPGTPFEQQMRKVWMTESVLCSARSEGAPVPAAAARACGERYLLPQLRLFSHALVVALGRKAQSRLSRVGFTSYVSAYAVAPPGCNRREARESWERIPVALREHNERIATSTVD